jgi:hypothetical protein
MFASTMKYSTAAGLSGLGYNYLVGFQTFREQQKKKDLQSMHMLSSLDGQDRRMPSEFNRQVMANGLKERLANYNPPWWYCNIVVGTCYCFLRPSMFKNNKEMLSHKVYLHNDVEGKIVLEVLEKKQRNNKLKTDEIVLILLPGTAGYSTDPYMLDLSGICA